MWAWITRGLVMLLMVTAIVAGRAGWAGQAASVPDDWLKPHLVRVDGQNLNLTCLGHGYPTVIFQQGGEGSIANWASVQPAITKLTRTCFYDRPGFGWSDPAIGPVDALRVTDQLHRLIETAKIDKPVVFVGHSIGGFYATLYADRFPQEVAGMVLVDPGFSGQFAPPTPAQRAFEQSKIQEGDVTFLDRCAALARAARLSASNPQGCFQIPPDWRQDAVTYELHNRTRAAWYEAERSQSDRYFPSGQGQSPNMAEEDAHARDFGDMPLIVLSSGIPPRNNWDTDESWAEKSARWREGHRRLAGRSTAGRFQIVAGAHHFIHKDNPNAVVDAIAQVVDHVRERRSKAP